MYHKETLWILTIFLCYDLTMKTLETWLSEYSESHQNHSNQLIHKVCVPLIFFSLLGVLWTVQLGPLNLAILFAVLVLPFYIRLGVKALAIILPQLFITFLILYYWQQRSDLKALLTACIAIFVIAWIGQFIGHKLEGKKPSFFKDLQFLLIGPLWIFKRRP